MLYFHEKCTSDVVSIITELNKRSSESVTEFKTALIDTYQRIYADEHGQHQIWSYNSTTSTASRFNAEPVRGFPFVVIFKREKGKKIVIAIIYNRKAMTRYV